MLQIGPSSTYPESLQMEIQVRCFDCGPKGLRRVTEEE